MTGMKQNKGIKYHNKKISLNSNVFVNFALHEGKEKQSSFCQKNLHRAPTDICVLGVPYG